MSEETPEQILTRLADELKPEVDRLVAEIGVDQVRQNIISGLARMEERRRQRAMLSKPEGSA